jgi:hypothetical protein
METETWDSDIVNLLFQKKTELDFGATVGVLASLNLQK